MLDPGANIYVYAGRHIPLDENGHLVNAGDWSRELAFHLAEADGIALDDRHWLIITFIRAYHGHYESVPMPKVLIKGLNKEAGAGAVHYEVPLWPVPGPSHAACLPVRWRTSAGGLHLILLMIGRSARKTNREMKKID